MEEKRDIIITRTDKNSWDYITYEGLRLSVKTPSDGLMLFNGITLPMRD